MTMRFHFCAALLAALALTACGNGQPGSDADIAASDSQHDDHDHEDHKGNARADDDHDTHGEEEHAHEDEDEHSDHVELDAAAAREAGIVVSRAERSPLRQTLSLPAELRFDADRVATISSQVSGRIIDLSASEGDTVERGEILAELSSRELADLKAEYLTAATGEDLARQALEREETLFADRITSAADLQAARAAFAAARAQREGVENKLHAVGVSHRELDRINNAPDGTLANIRLSAPIGGIIAQRTATLGATVSADDPGAPALFTIVDDSVLWADIAVYKTDAGAVQTGAPVILRTDAGVVLTEGEIATVLPAINEVSRTATARMVVENAERRMRPGQFVTADIAIGAGEERLQVPSNAIVEVEGRTSVFVPAGDGFAPRPVTLGPAFSAQTVILSGLSAGDEFVSEGAFTLKAQLEKDAFGDDHDH